MSHILDDTLFIATASKTIANSSDETSAIPTGVGSLTTPANFFDAGVTIRLTGGGIFSTLITPGNLTVKIKLGTVTVVSTVISNLLASATNNAFQFSATLSCRTIGGSGTFIADGQINYETGTLTRGFAALNNAGAAATVDTTISNDIDVTVQWQTANASNTISVTNARIELVM